MNGRVTVREARRADGPTIVQFIRELAAYEREPEAAKAGVADIEAALFGDRPRVFGLIAEIDGAPAGFAVYFSNFSTWTGRHGVYLEDLYVREDRRGGGAGAALLARLARIARDEGCARLEWSVLDWNAPAIDFYRALGAAAMTDWTVYRVTGAAMEALAARDR
jgi:GNAT superfamily N-acetyltransferase